MEKEKRCWSRWWRNLIIGWGWWISIRNQIM